MHSRACLRRSQTGLSLIELLIGMALGLLLTAGILQLFFGTKSTYTAQDGFSKMQESARFASEFLTTEMRMGGLRSLCYDYFGSDFVEITNHLSNADQLPFSAAIGVWGWDYDGTGNGDTYTLPLDMDPSTEAVSSWAAGDGVGDLPAELEGLVVPGSDVLLVKRITQIANWTGDEAATPGATSIPITNVDDTIDVNLGASGLEQGDVVLVTNCQSGDLFVNTSAVSTALTSNGSWSPSEDEAVIDSLSNDGVALGVYDDSAQIYRFNSTLFYVGRREDSTTTSLFKVNLGSGGVPVELVENVESMQVMFGTTDDTEARDRVTQYVTADSVGDWLDVMTVRIGLLLRSPDNADPAAVARTMEVNELTVDVPADRALRTVFTLDTTPRNLVRIYPY